MKHIIEFELPEDQSELYAAQHGMDYRIILQKYVNWMDNFDGILTKEIALSELNGLLISKEVLLYN